jgi:hypothetical protein
LTRGANPVPDEGDPEVVGEFVLARSNKQQATLGFLAAGGFVLLAGCATTSDSSPQPITQLSLNPQSNYIIEAQARGRLLRLRVDPGAPFYVLLNDKIARDLRLVSTKAATLAVGPTRLKASTRNEKLTIGGVTAAKPVMWVKGEAILDADGIINPANLGNDVTLQLREATGAEQVIQLPMRFDRQRGLYYEFDYGGQLILTRFTLEDKLTTTTGAAASVIAKRRNGIWDGGPFVHEVRFGVPRPVRKMVLGETLSVKGFPVNAFAVRMQDDRGSYLLPDKETPSEEDEDGIVVTGKNKRGYGAAHFWMMVGSDDLSRCSSISYDNKAKHLILRCSTTRS